MRRYISNKGLRICYQTDHTQNMPGPDGQIVNIVKQPLIECVFEKLVEGRYGFTPYDLPAAFQAYSRVVAEVPTWANVRDVAGADGVIDTPYRTEPIMVPVHGFGQGARKLGVVKRDETVIEAEQAINPQELLWVFDVDKFCQENKHAKGLEQDIEEFLDGPRSGNDHVRVVAPPIQLPFDGYDRLKSAKRIGMLVGELEIDPNRVIAWEEANPRTISKDVVEVMRKRLAGDTGETVEEPELVQA